MRILFLSRSTLFSQPGGDSLEMQQIAIRLRELGCEVHIARAGENVNASTYDIVHFFNLFRPADLLPYLPNIRKLVINSIYVDYSEYDSLYRGIIWQILQKLFGKFSLEYFKTLARWVCGKEHFPGTKYLIKGQKESIHVILQRADHIITASNYETEMILRDFTISKPEKFSALLLGAEHFEPKDSKENRSGIVCAARIEGRKNQLNLIKAVQPTGLSLHIFGQAATHQRGYLKTCKAVAGKQVIFKGHVSQEELAHHLPRYKVHVLPSFFETTGLSTIEALKAGCQAVISDRGGQREIFGDHAFYCNPASAASIRQAIEEAIKCDTDHREWVEKNFRWMKGAREIMDIYRKVIGPTKI